MDMSTAFGSLNWFAILVSAFTAFVIGGLWYGPLFGKSWQKLNRLTDEDLKSRNLGLVFGLSFLAAFIAAFNLAMFIGPEADVSYGMTAGFLAGFGWVATMVAMHFLFEKRPLKLYFINAGYSVIALTIMGAILGAWH
jgi:hypothetical protein